MPTKTGHARRGAVSPTYNSWRSMVERCENPNAVQYRFYGGRGIAITPRWRGKGGFENFLADLGERPEGKSLDRIDVNGHYWPANCRWATQTEQLANRRPPVAWRKQYEALQAAVIGFVERADAGWMTHRDWLAAVEQLRNALEEGR